MISTAPMLSTERRLARRRRLRHGHPHADRDSYSDGHANPDGDAYSYSDSYADSDARHPEREPGGHAVERENRQGKATFTVAVSPASNHKALTITYAMSGTALRGTNYALSGTSFAVPANVGSANLTLNSQDTASHRQDRHHDRSGRLGLRRIASQVRHRHDQPVTSSHTLNMKISRLLLTLCLLGAAATVRATSVIPPSFDQLVGQAQVIFQGTVTRRTVRSGTVKARSATSTATLPFGSKKV